MTTRWIEWALLLILGVAAVNLAQQINLSNPFDQLAQALTRAVGGNR